MFNQRGTIKDDPSWLPLGPHNRLNNATGIYRYQKGYIAYAGSGKDSRLTQLIMAFEDNKYLGKGFSLCIIVTSYRWWKSLGGTIWAALWRGIL